MPQPVRVTGKDGWRGIVHSWFGQKDGESREITIRLDTGQAIVVPDTLLQARPDGSYYVALSLAELAGTQRVHKTSSEKEETVDVPLLREQVEVERVKVDRVAEGSEAVRQEGDTIIVPVVEEVLVVRKELRVVEEVRIRKTRTEKRDPQTVVLRKEEAHVEALGDTYGGADDLRAV